MGLKLLNLFKYVMMVPLLVVFRRYVLMPADDLYYYGLVDLKILAPAALCF